MPAEKNGAVKTEVEAKPEVKLEKMDESETTEKSVKMEKTTEKSVKMEETTEESDSKEDKPDSENVEEILKERKGFSSEDFKIEIQNLPRFFSIAQMKKILNSKLELNPHKLKPVGKGARYMFVNFANEEDREKAVERLNGFRFKGNRLKAFKTRPAKDPMLKVAEKEEPVDDRPASEKVMEAVCPLAEKSYEDQLKFKTENVEELLKNLRTRFMKQNGFFISHNISDKDLAHLEEFIVPKNTDGYRNKCEFSIGRHPDTNEVTVGFRLASYKKGSIAVAEVDHLPNVSKPMKDIVNHFKKFVKTSGYPPFDQISHYGYWKHLTVRQSFQNKGDMLVWVVFHPQDLTEEKKYELKTDLIEHFEGFKPAVTSLNLQFFGKSIRGQPESPVECIQGETFIREKIMNLTFKVSPQAFFQINTELAEKLFESCGQIANLDKNTVLFDVCCGTGTIGLCLASKVKEVHGVDIVEEAIEDAKANAETNGVTNAHFHAGRAEHLLPELLKKHCSTDENCKSVAIVDPPRAGLHPKAIFALRASNVQTLVYVSCDARAAMNNFIDLGRMTSKAYKGDPFVPKKVIPVDLFPHTRHFELVILFERFPLKEALNVVQNY